MDFSGGTPDGTRFVLRGKGKWLSLSLDLPATSKVTRWGYPIKSVASMGALNSATDSVSFHDGARLHIKLVGNGDWEELRVRRP